MTIQSAVRWMRSFYNCGALRTLSFAHSGYLMKLRSTILAATLATGLATASHIDRKIAAQTLATVATPRFEVQAGWAKVPEKWKLGDVSSVAADQQDNIWVLHRPRTLSGSDLQAAAPPVLQFDANGNFLQGWGGAGRGYEWPEREHGIYLDRQGGVWIGGNNCAERMLPGLKPVDDDQLVKFNTAGKFVMQIGRSNASKGNADTVNMHAPADVVLYDKTNELFVADGYGNHRVAVYDARTGAFKRMWGAFGNKPVDHDVCPPPEPGPVANDGTPGPSQFAILHAIRVSNDGLVYVGDRENKRIQVFSLDGRFINQVYVNRDDVKASRTTGGLAFSSDPQQTYLYAAGGRIAVLERRTLKVLTLDAGPGGHHIGTDSKGNIYTASGKTVQKLVFKGAS